MNAYSKWFSRMVWIGIVGNLALAGAAIAAPHATLSALGQMAAPNQTFWIQAAGSLLIFLSLFYMPGAWDPLRYRANAWLAVISRAAGVVFFFAVFPGDYPLFGLVDFVFLILQAPLLLLMARTVPSPEYYAYG